jgi:hypothetical protein
MASAAPRHCLLLTSHHVQPADRTIEWLDASRNAATIRWWRTCRGAEHGAERLRSDDRGFVGAGDGSGLAVEMTDRPVARRSLAMAE